jgi:hypothetical protein
VVIRNRNRALGAIRVVSRIQNHDSQTNQRLGSSIQPWFSNFLWNLFFNGLAIELAIHRRFFHERKAWFFKRFEITRTSFFFLNSDILIKKNRHR